MPVDDLTRLMGGERVLSFPHICEHITLHDPANIHISLVETRRDRVNYRDESGEKKERKKTKKVRKRRERNGNEGISQYISPDTDSLVLIQ